MLVVGLTGGIASGKSVVSGEFEKLGVPVIDTDIIAKRLVKPGAPALERIVDTFGSVVLEKNGELNRRLLRELILNDDSKRKKLESILHPMILEEVQRELGGLTENYCIVVIPLLVETGIPNWIDTVLVVDSDVEVRIQRLIERDNVSHESACLAIKAQAPESYRLAIANDVISNNGTIKELRQSVAHLHKKYSRQSFADHRGTHSP